MQVTSSLPSHYIDITLVLHVYSPHYTHIALALMEPMDELGRYVPGLRSDRVSNTTGSSCKVVQQQQQ